MYEILTTSNPLQVQTFRLFGFQLTFTLRYNTIAKGWNYDLYDHTESAYICQGLGLSVSAPSLISKPLPFVVVLVDKSGFGINSIYREEMGQRLGIYFMSKESFYAAIRSPD